jgi:hypothetical protein
MENHNDNYFDDINFGNEEMVIEEIPQENIIHVQLVRHYKEWIDEITPQPIPTRLGKPKKRKRDVNTNSMN